MSSPLSCSDKSQVRFTLLRALSSQALSISKNEDATTSVNNLLQYLTFFIVKHFFLICRTSPAAVSAQCFSPCHSRGSSSLQPPIRQLKTEIKKPSPRHPFYKMKNPPVSDSLCIMSSSLQLSGPALDSLQYEYIFLVLVSPNHTQYFRHHLTSAELRGLMNFLN